MIVSFKFNRKRLCFVVLHFLAVFFELFTKQIKHQFYDNEFNFSHCENVPCVVPHQEIIARVRNPTFGWRLYLACYEWYEGAQDEAFTPKVKYSSQGRRSRRPQNTQSLLYTHRARRSIRRWKLAYLRPLPQAGRSFREDVTHRPVFHIHIPWFAHSLSPRARRMPLPLLDLLFSLVRVHLMPLSMLIVHRSKAAFIKMIKCSQTTAEYLKASGRTTWQVTTSHANSPPSSPPTPPPPCFHWWLLVTGSWFESRMHLMRNDKETKGAMYETNVSTHAHTHTQRQLIPPIPIGLNAQWAHE